VDLIYARENAIAGDFAEAVLAYKRLPEVFLLSPAVLIEAATALTKTGEYDGALSLINAMHKKQRFTKNSLELFRDITFKMKFMKESEAAQRILENEYKDDAGIQYSRAVLSIKNGDTDKALEILTGLIKKYPEERQFEIARISVYLAKEDYNRVIQECLKSRVEPYLLRQLKARAFMKLGKFEMIESMYQELIKQKKSPAIMLEYAQLLTGSEKYEKAVPVFKDLLNLHKKELEKDTLKNALILNNYAWALLNTQSGQKSLALSIAKRSHDLSPNDLHILDTYVYALNQNNRYKESVNLLKERSEVEKEPKLLYYLGTAYDRMGDKNRALRTYQDALTAIDTTKNQLSLSTNAGSIQKRINELMTEK
jgi:predicted Zn-dependent protease